MDKITELQQKVASFGKRIADVFISAGYITGLILGIIGLILVLIELNKFYKISQINNWPVLKSGATIIDNHFETYNTSDNLNLVIYNNSSSYNYYRTRFLFKYKINGDDYVGTRYSYYEPWTDNPVIAKSIEQSFKIGSKVNVVINPTKPSEAYIFNHPYDNFNRLVIGFALVIVGFYTLQRANQ